MNVLYGQLWLVTTAGFNPVYLSRAFRKVERFVAFCAELLPLPTPLDAGPSRSARLSGPLAGEGGAAVRSHFGGRNHSYAGICAAALPAGPAVT